MPLDDYTTSTVRGGLKLKGSSSNPSGITKKKKKKSKPSTDEATKGALQKALEEEDEGVERDVKGKGKGKGIEERGEGLTEQELRELDPKGHDGKTASERAYEEMRRKRLQDRLQKEGVKTHKQRVEELNKYLSNLSEHHDMPRIGPG